MDRPADEAEAGQPGGSAPVGSTQIAQRHSDTEEQLLSMIDRERSSGRLGERPKGQVFTH